MDLLLQPPACPLLLSVQWLGGVEGQEGKGVKVKGKGKGEPSS